MLNALDAAQTRMDAADASSMEQTILRNHKNARLAYDTALQLLRNLRPDVLQQQAIDSKLASLKERLLAAGPPFWT